jgi:DMSO/TMAO reductase YedYZ molybdopterin-dependent catalytic subunit
MRKQLCLFGVLACAFAALTLSLGCYANLFVQDAHSAQLKITGVGDTPPLILSAADLKKMPRKTLSVVNQHEKKTEVYEGVPLAELLQRVGVPQGEKPRGAAMASYVVAEASEGYRVVFSLAELDPGFLESDVIVADTMNGASLGPSQGPFKIVAPHDKRPARWIRMLKSVAVAEAAK